jgi:acetyl esterase/lipase
MTNEVVLDIRPRAMLRITNLLAKLHLFQSPEELCKMPYAQRRAAKPAQWLTGPMPSGIRIASQDIDSRGGSMALRIYEPRAVNAAHRPLVVYIHGGGWVSGGLDSSEHLCAHIAAESGAPVVSVDYRLAPEHPYPAALEDCYDALCWAAAHASPLGIDDSRIAVAGDSAGGNLAAALCLLVKHDGGPAIAHQALLYPSLDATLASPSMSLTDVGPTRNDIHLVLNHYLGGHDPTDPLFSPLFAPDLSDLPPTLIITANGDVLRDDGKRYAARLAEAGVPVRYTNYLGMPHGFVSTPRLCRSARHARAELVHEVHHAVAASRSRWSAP